MTAGPQTFIGQLIALAGGTIDLRRRDARTWPNVAMEEIVRRDPDMLIVPVGEFKDNSLDRFRAMAGWRDLRAVREGHVVDRPGGSHEPPEPEYRRGVARVATRDPSRGRRRRFVDAPAGLAGERSRAPRVAAVAPARSSSP